MKKLNENLMINFKLTNFAIVLLITTSSNALSQSMSNFSATCWHPFSGTVKIAYIKELNQIKTITNMGQISDEINTIKNPKISSDNFIFSNDFANRKFTYTLNRKTGILESESHNGLGIDLIKYQCEKSNDESSVLKEIYQLQNKPNKF